MGTWKKAVSGFLQKCFLHVRFPGSISLRNSDEVVEDLQPFHEKKRSVVTLDIKDLYYSLSYGVLLSRLRILLEENIVAFQNNAGISVENFLRVLQLYLQATVIEVDSIVYIQKKGVCIGSAVAPVLAEVFLHSLDSGVRRFLEFHTSDSAFVGQYGVIPKEASHEQVLFFQEHDALACCNIDDDDTIVVKGDTSFPSSVSFYIFIVLPWSPFI